MFRGREATRKTPASAGVLFYERKQRGQLSALLDSMLLNL